MVNGPKWKGMSPPVSSGGKAKAGKIIGGKGGNPIGSYKLGRKTKSKKLSQVMG